MIYLLLHQWSGKEPRKKFGILVSLSNVLSTNHLHVFKLGRKKKLKRAGRVWEKAAHFLLPQEKGTMALIHLEVKLENSRTMALTVQTSISLPCLPLATRAETPHKNMIPNSGQGCRAMKDHPLRHTPLNSCILYF